jgi:hypothetical protein
MRRWGFASVAWTIVVFGAMASAAYADDAPTGVTATTETEPAATPAQAIGYGALPGGIHVAAAETLPQGVAEVATLAGYGYRPGLLQCPMCAAHTLSRAIGDLAVAYAPAPFIAFSLSLDGRYDRHSGGPTPTTNSGAVGDPHLYIRVAKEFGATRVGAQIGLWTPGRKAPSLVASATSIDLRLLLSVAAGPGMLSINAGFQFDNSINSADTPPIAMLSLQDRTSLGVSDYNEAYGGLSLLFPAGPKAWIGLEGSIEAFVGSPRTTGAATLQEGAITVRGAAFGGVRFNDTWALLAFVEIAKVPGIQDSQVTANLIPILPYEPLVTAGLGLQARIGGKKKQSRELFSHTKKCFEHVPPDCKPVTEPLATNITGKVVDENDKPIVGAKVTLKLSKSDVPPVVTDETGTYVFKGVRIGDSAKTATGDNKFDEKVTIDEPTAEVTVEVDKKKPGHATLSPLTHDGNNVVPPVRLEPLLSGQLKVIVSKPGGKPLGGATISVGDKQAETDKDGLAVIDLPPGKYKVTIRATGFATQELDFTINPPNGLVVKQAEMHR